MQLITLYLSDRCNSRCVTCDYWRHGRADMDLQAVRRLLPSLRALGTEVVLISGGEPTVNREWLKIVQLLRSAGLKLWLLTSGLSLEKHAAPVSELFDAVTVSLDGANRETYAAIRGVDAFDKVCDGVRAAARAGLAPSIRVTLQRANFRELPAFVDLARELGAREISFLAVDVANPHVFARAESFNSRITGTQGFNSALALAPHELPLFARLLDDLETTHAADFHAGFIAESPHKLRGILRYFSALCGRDDYPSIRCNAPEFSAVIDAELRVRPCFFIPGPAGVTVHDGLGAALTGKPMQQLRADIRAGRRAECATCVCPLWREPDRAEVSLLPPRAPSAVRAASAI